MNYLKIESHNNMDSLSTSKKVILINSPLFRERVDDYSEDSLPPLGLGYLGTQLKEKGHDVIFHDAIYKNSTVEELCTLINEQNPDFIGINVFSTNFEIVKDIISHVECITHFIVGGQACKFLFSEIIKIKTDSNIDVIIGDGEYIISDIVGNNVREEPFLEEGSTRVFKVDLNSIYYDTDFLNSSLDRSFFDNEPSTNRHGLMEAFLVTSKGCYHNCAFCGAARSLNGDVTIRIKTTEKIQEEIQNLLEIYPGLESVRILDDLFIRSIKDIKRGDEIFGRKVKWRTMAHLNSFRGATKEDFDLLKESGCYEVFLGIESGSKRVLKNINKPHKLNELLTTVISLLEVGINVKGYVIIGFPEETLEDIEKTFNFVKSIKNKSLKLAGDFIVSPFQFRPYHGTILYNQLFEKIEIIQFKNNEELNSTKRKQFDFFSENFSDASPIEVNAYLNKIIELNDR